MTLVIPFPEFDPILVEFGPFAIRWYALAWIAGLLVGWQYVRMLAARMPGGVEAHDIDDFVTWATIAVVLGGRLGYVLFYNPGYYLANPVEIVYMWRGGMSFHGGLLGMTVAMVWFTRRRGIGLLAFTDLIACAAPLGQFFGRIANFINGELWGRPSDVPWAMVFPHADDQARHPSQLYSSLLEGLVLFIAVFLLWRFTRLRDRPGALTGCFLIGYGIARIVVELFREPDAQLGFIFAGVTMGQILSLPLIAGGLYLLRRSKPHTPVAEGGAAKGGAKQ